MDRSISAHEGLEPSTLTSCPAHILDNSDLTLNQFNEKLCSAIININGDFKDFVSNIPDFILLSTALIKHAHVILPALYGLNQINPML